MNELFTLDQRHNTIVDLTENVRIDRERKKAELRRIQLKLQGEREMEAKLDKQLEDILGRAVTMADLDLLYA
jgi:hemolysin activation/secretion protein